MRQYKVFSIQFLNKKTAVHNVIINTHYMVIRRQLLK